MPTSLEQLTLKVDKYVRFFTKKFNNEFPSLSPLEQEAMVIRSLQKLVKDFGTHEYGFNLSIEKYVEYFSDETARILPNILEANLPRGLHWTHTTKTDIAFAAYYALSLIYKKSGNTNELKSLTEQRYTTFSAHYPLTSEVLARYYKRTGKYERALECDQDVIDELGDQGIVNYGPCISYASTVCRMYDSGLFVSTQQIDNAETYIQAAIEFNPDYAKYYYLRGKLAFYKAQNIAENGDFLAVCEEALRNLSTARRLLRALNGNYNMSTLDEYHALSTKITSARDAFIAMGLAFQEVTDNDWRQRIEAIKLAEDTSDCLPPNPNLQDGRKYFFVSYSHKDFKSVYPDLLMLYRQRIPFQFDGGLPFGERWDVSVKPKIQSENCLGVLFYVSQHTLLSNPVEKECMILKEHNNAPNYLIVKLGKNESTTDILINTIVTQKLQGCHEHGVTRDRIKNYLEMFHDDILHISRPSSTDPDDPIYARRLMDAIRARFPGLVVGQ